MRELVFQFVCFAPGVLWLALFFFPLQKWVTVAIDVVVVIFCVVFCANLFPGIESVWPVLLKPTLPAVGNLLSSDAGALGAWTQLVIADLWFGRWISNDAIKIGVPHRVRIPILFVTLLFGPLGLLSYLLARCIKLKRLALFTN